jgi:succinoglycan biosynthesis protein ExoM
VADVVVAVLTYRRNAELAALLPELGRQVDSSGRAGRVLVVDNDPDAGARATVAEAADPRISYAHEPEPGIAAARNRALDEAAGDDVLVFIDDDEKPCTDWLERLLVTYQETSAAAVVGSVESEYAVAPSDWVVAGKFFRRRRLVTGTEIDVAATNNLLLDMAVIRRLGLRFDGAFGLSGGSDTLFTRRLAASGGRMVWCDEALVIDHVPAARVTRDWVLRRALRSGNSWGRTSVELQSTAFGRAKVRLVVGATGAGRASVGFTQYLAGKLTRNLALEASGLRRGMRGTGMVSGVFGHVYVEYKRKA